MIFNNRTFPKPAQPHQSPIRNFSSLIAQAGKVWEIGNPVVRIFNYAGAFAVRIVLKICGNTILSMVITFVDIFVHSKKRTNFANSSQTILLVRRL